MSDTLEPCLIDVTNNKIASIATLSKDGALTSQDDSGQISQLSSPSSASTMSSPSSLVDITTATVNSSKRPYPIVSPTSLENGKMDQNRQHIQASPPTINSTLGDDGPADSSSGQTNLQQGRCNYCGSTDSTQWNGIHKCCQGCYADQYTTMATISDMICSDTTTPKRRRFDQDIQQQDHLDSIFDHSTSTIETQSPPTVSSISTSASSHSAPTSSIAQSLLTSSSVPTHTPTLPSNPSTSIDKLNTSSTSSSSQKTTRLCLECKATDPPLWRNGPDGKKTLCNACGIRYSKFLRGVLSQWHKSPSDTQKKKPNTKRQPKETTTAADPASISTATSLIKKKPVAVLSESRSKKCDTLHERKTYLKAGMHSGGFRTVPLPFTFSLPLHQGALLLDTERDFELPLDIIEDYESGRLYGWTDYSISKKPPRYIRILHNSFVERKARKEEHQAVCHCLPPASGVGCGEDCLNRMMFFECDPTTCPCGDLCSNQKFRQRQFVKGLKVYLTEGRGWGIMTKEFIRKGTLITEYRGEIISDKTCQERIRTVYKHQKNFYFLDYHKGEVIDACNKGSEARFINHGCDPNCHIEKWSRNGEYHLGVFASKDIPIDTELFYDYNFSLFDTEAIGQECCCGSSKCRGFLGKRPTHPKKVVNS